MLRAVLESPDRAVAALKQGEKQVKDADYPVQAPLADQTLPVLQVIEGRRQRVQWNSIPAALAELGRDPRLLSPGVHLRPMVQDCLLPTMAAVVGPSEAAYQAQLGPLYQFLGRPQPVVLPLVVDCGKESAD